MISYIYCPWKLSARKLIFFQRSWKSGFHLGYNSTRYLALISGKVNGFLQNEILFNIGNIGSRTTTHHRKWFLLVELPSLCVYTRGVRTDCSHRSTLRGWAAFWASTSVHSSYWCRNKHQTDISQQSPWQNNKCCECVVVVCATDQMTFFNFTASACLKERKYRPYRKIAIYSLLLLWNIFLFFPKLTSIKVDFLSLA